MNVLGFVYFHIPPIPSEYLFKVIVFILFLTSQELQWNVSQVLRETTSLWLMCIEHLMIFWRRDQWKWVWQSVKRFIENGARKILLIAGLSDMLVTFTGNLTMFKLNIKIFFVIQSGHLCILIPKIPFAGRFRDMLNKWVWVFLLVEMICFNSADALLLPFSSMQL